MREIVVIYTVTLNPAVDRELTVPAIEFNTVLRATAWRVDYGGKGFNVSRMLKSLGVESVALGFAGGRAGEVLRDGLESLGIATDFIWIAGETRTNVSIVNEVHDRYLKVNEPGPAISPAAQEALLAQVQRLVRHTPESSSPESSSPESSSPESSSPESSSPESSSPESSKDWWVLAGSLPPGLPASLYADLIHIVQEAGGRAVLDTSGQALYDGCAARPFLAKPNDAEAGKITGLPVATVANIAATAQAIGRLGVANVVISLGKKGALMTNGAETWLATTPPIQEGNPIGAGDSMVGGLVWGLSQGHDLPEALRWGIACGAATASLAGTAVGSRTLVEELATQVEIRLCQEFPMSGTHHSLP